MRNQTVVFPEPGDVALVDGDRPVPGPDEVLVETACSLVSTGTELTILDGDFPEGGVWDGYAEYPFEAGYANVGTVVEVGDCVDEAALKTTVATHAPHTRWHVVEYDRCIAVPSALTPAEASFFKLAAIAMNGVRRGRVQWGESAVVFGCGLLGQLAVRACRVAGARPVIGVEPLAARRERLPSEPAVHGTGIEGSEPHETVRSATDGRLADVAFEVTGRGDAIPGEFDVLAAPLGRLVVLSSPREPTTIDLHDRCNHPSHEIIGAHQGSHPPVETPQTPWTFDRHAELFFDLVAEATLDVESLISHRVPPSEAPDLYRDLSADRSGAMGVLIDW